MLFFFRDLDDHPSCWNCGNETPPQKPITCIDNKCDKTFHTIKDMERHAEAKNHKQQPTIEQDYNIDYKW